MTETSSSKARPEDGFLVLRLGRLGVLRDLRGGMMKVCSYKLAGVREQDKLQASKETLTQRRRVRGVNAPLQEQGAGRKPSATGAEASARRVSGDNIRVRFSGLDVETEQRDVEAQFADSIEVEKCDDARRGSSDETRNGVHVLRACSDDVEWRNDGSRSR